MIVANIHYGKNFLKKLKNLPPNIIKVTLAKEQLFRTNPLHPSLRLHQLHGELSDSWSISLTNNYRIIFERQPNGDILFMSVGQHDIYKQL